jgi:hypothetical protein
MDVRRIVCVLSYGKQDLCIRKKYILHEQLLMHHSCFSRGALSGNFKETDDGVIPLSDIDTQAFDIFIGWMYERTLPDSVKVPDVADEIPVRWRAYTLAERLLASGWKHSLMDMIFNYYGRTPPASRLVIYLFDNLAAGHLILRLAIDMFSFYDSFARMTAEDKELVPQLPKEFVQGVFFKMNAIAKLAVRDRIVI